MVIRIIAGIILSLILTFADEINILYNPLLLFLIGCTIIGLLLFQDDFGITLLTCALFAIVFNIQTHKRENS
jgi:hypothetical protein